METIKLNIAATLKQSFALYRKNFGALLKFALVGVLCNLPAAAGNYIKGLEDDRIARAREALYAPGVMDAMDVTERLEATEVLFRSTGLAFLCLALMALSLVLWLAVELKNELGAQFYLADAMVGRESEKPTMKSAYAKTKGKVSTLFGMYLILGIICCICAAPFVILFVCLVTFAEVDQSLLRLASIPVIVPVSLLSYPWFFLIPPLVMDREEESPKFSLISQMTKGNYLRIIAVSFIGVGISTLSGSFLREVDVNPLIAFGMTSAITLFTFGFNSAAAFVTYQTLKPEPDEEQPPEDTPQTEPPEASITEETDNPA